MPTKTISVVIPTYNRPKELRGVVDSLLKQTIKPHEIIIVDNNSNPPVDLKVDFPGFKLLRNNQEMGSSIGRNQGVKMATGEYMAFLDDDCVAEENWIEEVQKGIDTGAKVIGGKIKPLYRAEPPDWWSEKDFGGCVGVGNIYRKLIWSGNMVVSREVFDKAGWFDPKLGRHKGKLLSAEELDFLNRAEIVGKPLFLPQAEVFHIVPGKRMTIRYVVRWCFNAGRSFKIMYGRNTLRTSYSIVRVVKDMLNPLMVRKKTARVRLITELALYVGKL